MSLRVVKSGLINSPSNQHFLTMKTLEKRRMRKADLTFTTPFGTVELNSDAANLAVICGSVVCLVYLLAKAAK